MSATNTEQIQSAGIKLPGEVVKRRLQELHDRHSATIQAMKARMLVIDHNFMAAIAEIEALCPHDSEVSGAGYAFCEWCGESLG